MGVYALDANTTGVENVAMGDVALSANTTGNNNTALGSYALSANTTAHNNTALGKSTLTSNTTGDKNTGLGKTALYANTTGVQNTSVGFESGDSVTTGMKNTFLGTGAGTTITTGSQNVCIGYEAGASETTSSYMLWLARDNSAAHNAGVWIYGNSGGACYQGNNSSSWSTSSDERIKKDIVNSSDGLAKIDALQVRNFNYRTPEEITVDGLTGCDASGLQTGVIAQEIESVLPKAVTENTKGLKQVNTDPIFWAMVKAIQELSAQNTALAARITTLEG